MRVSDREGAGAWTSPSRPEMGAYQRSYHILLDGTLAPRGCVSKVKPYPHWRGPGPETGRIEIKTICSLTGPWPRERAYQRPNHIILEGPWPRVGARQSSSHILPGGALAPRRGHVIGQTIYSLTGLLPREGAYQLSNDILLDGALASRGGMSKVKPYTS